MASLAFVGAPHSAAQAAALSQATQATQAASSRSFQDAPSGLSSMATSGVAALCLLARRSARAVAKRRHRTPQTATPSRGVQVSTGLDVPEEIQDIGVAGRDVDTPHWSQRPMEDVQGGLRLEQLDWPNVHGISCGASGVLFLYELVRFCLGQAPSDLECYAAALIYAVIYASRFDGIRTLAPHFRVTFYATTGWCIYYIAHLLAATNPAIFSHWVYPTGVVFLASSIYFYKHWIERMYRHFVEDRFRPYYVPGLVGLMYFHWLDTVDMMNQWLDPQYWEHVVVDLPDQAWTIADVRLTGLFMSSMALFMITLHNKGVLTGGKNTLITVLFTIFVPALFLTGTHATLQASFP